MGKTRKAPKRSEARAYNCVRLSGKWFTPGMHVRIKNEFHDRMGFIDSVDSKGLRLDVGEEKLVYFNLASVEYIKDLDPMSRHDLEDMVKGLREDNKSLEESVGKLTIDRMGIKATFRTYQAVLTYMASAMIKVLDYDDDMFNIQQLDIDEAYKKYQFHAENQGDVVEIKLKERTEDEREAIISDYDTTGTEGEEEFSEDTLQVVTKEEEESTVHSTGENI